MSAGPGHGRWEDAAGTYVLGALPEDERAGYEAHVQDCPACRAEIEELRVAAEALPMSAPAMRPPPALKARLMAEVEREAALLASAGPQADRPAPRTRRRWLPSLRLPTAAVAALACAAGLAVGALVFGGGGGQTVEFSSQAARASAELDVSDGRGVLVARDLPAPPQGRVYQVWVQRPGKAPEPTAALFRPRADGSATASVGSVDGVEKVMVSAEPDGGSPAPTTNPILTATLT